MDALERASQNAAKVAEVRKTAERIFETAAAVPVPGRDAEMAAVRAYAMGILRKSGNPELRRGAYEALIAVDGEPTASAAADEAEITRRQGL